MRRPETQTNEQKETLIERETLVLKACFNRESDRRYCGNSIEDGLEARR